MTSPAERQAIKHAAQEAVQAAQEALQRGERGEARRLARRASILAPDFEEAWLLLAQLASPRASLAYCQRALQVSPASPRARAALIQAQARITGSIQPGISPAVDDLAAAVTDMSRPAYATPAAPAPSPKKELIPTSTLLQAASILLAAVLLFGGYFVLRSGFGSRPAAIPTPTSCPLSLTIAGRAVPVHAVPPSPDGSWNLPPDSGQAYWVEGTNNHTIFLLSPDSTNLSLLQSVQAGDTASFTSRDCAATTYNLGQLTEGAPDPASQLNQRISQITIYLPPSSAAAGYVLIGPLQDEELQRVSTPDPDSQLLEISLGEIKTSPDRSEITIQITIQNYAKNAVLFNPADTTLTPDGAAPLAVIRADPTLPLQLKPGAAEEVQLTFLRPTLPSAVLRVFSVEYTIEGY